MPALPSSTRNPSSIFLLEVRPKGRGKVGERERIAATATTGKGSRSEARNKREKAEALFIGSFAFGGEGLSPFLAGEEVEMFPPGLIHHRSDGPGPGEVSRSGGAPSLVLTADPKPRLRWTADLHERFVDAVAQLGGPERSYLLDAQGGMSLSPRVSTQDAKECQEVKEALRAQMEMQRCLHDKVEVQKHVDIRMGAHQTYINNILAKACKIVSEQFASSNFSISDHNLPELSSCSVMCDTPTDALSSSIFHQLSVSSMSLHSPGGGKPSPSGMEGQLLLQRSPEFKRKSC